MSKPQLGLHYRLESAPKALHEIENNKNFTASEELQRRETRLKRIREAKRALEERAREKAKAEGKPVEEAQPKARDQHNSLRGFEKVKAEWALVCATHNLLKMYRVCYG